MYNDFSNDQHINVVTSFSDLVQHSFQENINAICWQRNLQGDFKEIVTKLELEDDITEVSDCDLMQLQLTEAGCLARQTLLQDIQLLTEYGASPTLNLLKQYQRDDELDFISTDVYSYHVDRSPIAVDTFLCTYYGAASDIIANEQVEQKILIPEIRAKLKALHADSDDTFEAFLQEYYFDLHYQPKSHAQPTNLGLGHIWRLATDHPTQKVPPCVHRAPKENEGEYRLLLIC